MTASATPTDPAAAQPPPELPGSLDGLFQALAGGALLGFAGRRGGRSGTGLRALGAGLLAGALAAPARRALQHAGTERRAAEVETSFTIEQPVREVFGFFSNLERLLPLLPEVESIADHQDGRTDWRLRAHGGPALEWQALVSKYVPGQVIAWESVPEAPIRSSGLVRFSAPSEGNTLVTLRVTFEPRELAFREAVRSLFARRTDARLRDALAGTAHELSAWARGREGSDVAAD